MAGWLSNLTELHYPSEIRDRLDRLKTGWEATDKVGQGNAAWEAAYKDFLAFYDKSYNAWALTYSQGTVDSISEREKDLAGWQDKLKYQGPTQRTAAPDPLTHALSDSTVKLAAGAGIALALWLALK